MCDMRASRRGCGGTQHEGIHPLFTHHFSMELLSTSDSALIQYLKHQPPLVMDFVFHPMIIIEQHSSHSNVNMSNRWLKSIFETLWHWDERPLQAQMCLKLTPHHGTPLSSAYTYGTHCGSEPTVNDITILLSFLLTHYFLYIYNPETISFGRGLDSSWEGNMLCQGKKQGSQHYWITAEWNYTGVKFSTQVDQV